MTNILFLLQFGSTLFMTGVIWIIQVVHYPLFARVGRELFADYEKSHATLISFVVIPPMLAELGLAFLLLFFRPFQIPTWAAGLGFGLVLLIWLATFFLQLPQHAILSTGFDETAHHLLVATNWIRTVAWTARSLLLFWCLLKMLEY